jgi:hypothetical protein
MRKIAMSVLAVAGFTGIVASAHAQSVGVEINRGGAAVYGYTGSGPYGRGYSGSNGYRAPLHAYRSDYYGYRADEARDRSDGTCGTYFYWNGARCVDARNK